MSGRAAPSPRSDESHRATRWTNLVAALGLLAVLPFGTACSGESTPPAEDRGPLPAPGARSEWTALAPGGRHAYTIKVAAGTLLDLAVEQDGVDVTVELLDRHGERLTRVDSPTGTAGEERLIAVTHETGRHPVIVEGIGAETGRYAVRVNARRTASARDRTWAAASVAHAEAQWLTLAGGEANARAAVPLYREALRGYRALEDEPAQAARSLAGLGTALETAGDPEQAVETLREASEALEAVGLPAEAATTLNALGNALRRVGELERAEAAHRAAIAAFRALDQPSGRAIALNDLGKVYEALGDLEGAIRSYEESLAVRREAGLPEQPAPLHNLGFAYGRIGYTDEALDFLRRSLELASEQGHPTIQADSLLALGWFHALDVDPAAALPYYDQAADLLADLDDPRREAVLLDWRASALTELGRFEEAEDGYGEALRRARKRGDDAGRRTLRVNLGLLELRRERPERARRHLEAARRIPAAGDPSAEAALLGGLAAAERAAGRPEAAWRHLDEALGLLEQVRAGLSRDSARDLYLSARRDLYDQAVDLLMELDRREPGAWRRTALETTERFRARGLAEALAARAPGADTHASASSARAARERELIEEVDRVETRWLTSEKAERSEADEAAVGRTLRRLWLEIERVRAESDGPPAVDPAEPMDATAIAALLDPGTQLLVYHLAEQASYLWVVSADGKVEAAELAGREQIERLARDLAHVLPRSDEAVAGAQERELARSLSDLVLQPAARLLTARRLAVVPDGALHLVPPGVLADPNAERPGELVRLVERHDLAILPSASVLELQRRTAAQRTAAPGLVAVVADPVYGPDDPRLGGRETAGDAFADPDSDLVRAARDLRLDRLDRLPHTAAEAAAVLRAAGTAAPTLDLLDFDASAKALRSGELAGFRIVHVAGHGLLDSVHPELSGVVLSLFEPDGRASDGFVRARELRALELPAELVVLSACRTGLGRELRAEGLIGLPHALFEAGARRVVASYWDVGDAATAELMKRFYRAHLEEGLPPAAALAKAERSLLAEPRWSAPFHWAGFALHGDWR